MKTMVSALFPISHLFAVVVLSRLGSVAEEEPIATLVAVDISLLTPNEVAVREECKPGLVKTAKAQSAWQGDIPKTRALSAPAVDPDRFEDEFPAVSKLANSMSNGRVRSAIGRPKKQNWLASLLSPSPPRR